MKRKLIGAALAAVLFLSACGAAETGMSINEEAETNNDIVVQTSVEVSSAETQKDVDFEKEEEADVEVSLEDDETEEETEVWDDTEVGSEPFEVTFEEALGDFDNTKDAYSAFIKYMVDNHVEVGMDGFVESYENVVARNKFAVLDIDGDNEEELVIDWTDPSAMVGYTSYIYKYDLNTGEWLNELEGGGELTVFDNGILYADAAHNQGYGFMWPYTILKYNESKDTFESIGYAESEDKELVIDSMESDAFYHYEYDPTECGTVYMFCAESMGYEWGYYTKEQFEEFNRILVGDARVMEIDYKYINKDSLEEILK